MSEDRNRVFGERDARAGEGGGEVQDLGLLSLSGEQGSLRPDGSALWNDLVGLLRVHHAHTQAGSEYSKRCRICQQGVEAVVEVVEGRTADGRDSVVSDTGADEKGSAPSSSDTGAPKDLTSQGDGWFHSQSEANSRKDVVPGNRR